MRRIGLRGAVGLIGFLLVACSSVTTYDAAPITVKGSGANLTAGNAAALAHVSGIRVTATLTCPAGQTCTISQQLASTLQRLAQRLNASDFTDLYLATSQDASGTYHLLMELPGKSDLALAQFVLLPGVLRFLDTRDTYVAPGTTVTPTQYKVLFTGSDLDPASIKVSLNQAQQPELDFTMRPNAQAHFAAYTAANIGNYLTISLDWQVLESATIQSKIDGAAAISGDLTLDQAHALVAILQHDPLPLAPTGVVAMLVTP